MPNSSGKKNTPTKNRIWIVIQEGGTSREHYCNAYDTEKHAHDFIKSAAEATYNCLGPFEVGLGDMVKVDKVEDILQRETSVVNPDDVENLMKVIREEA